MIRKLIYIIILFINITAALLSISLIAITTAYYFDIYISIGLFPININGFALLILTLATTSIWKFATHPILKIITPPKELKHPSRYKRVNYSSKSFWVSTTQDTSTLLNAAKDKTSLFTLNAFPTNKIASPHQDNSHDYLPQDSISIEALPKIIAVRDNHHNQTSPYENKRLEPKQDPSQYHIYDEYDWNYWDTWNPMSPFYDSMDPSDSTSIMYDPHYYDNLFDNPHHNDDDHW